MANKLNALPNGASQDWVQWRKTSRQEKISVWYRGQSTSNDNVEDKILGLITPVCVTGNENVPDPFVLEEMPHRLDYDYCGDLEDDTDMAIEVGQADVANTELKGINASQATNLESLNPVLNTDTSIKRPHKRVNKTMRLTESIKNNKRFLQLTEELMKSTKNYQTEKLEILKSYYEQKIKIENRKVKALEDISNSINKACEYLN
ncbi:unnamed protein product [Acanthoscelides obtectus]|uniref:Uncharacterized protein n=1 Tax=Acanthoscelides obtectus TaxID=200917 RepID=A0A9P0LVW2_ACAOB|nr:unnamed protein product [Acanthoscelides obtectus]CAK1651379.1 hypothetical protein AOBTE_LOCUS17237 [Acanthoscelides obtectus]